VEYHQTFDHWLLTWVCFISVETVPKVAAKAAKFLGKTFGTFLLSTRLKHTLLTFNVSI
jgi:hypothetical protein